MHFSALLNSNSAVLKSLVERQMVDNPNTLFKAKVDLIKYRSEELLTAMQEAFNKGNINEWLRLRGQRNNLLLKLEKGNSLELERIGNHHHITPVGVTANVTGTR